MEKIIELTVKIPNTNATEEEIKEYLEFELGYNGSIILNNPLLESSGIDVINMSISD